MLLNWSFLAFIQLASSVVCAPVDSSPNPRLVFFRAPSSFIHPGVFLSRAELDFAKSKVNATAEPWTSAYKSMMASSYGSLTRVAHPSPTVECGPTSTPNLGCTDERQDALAAYAMSLAWYITGTKSYANKAIEYMNAWSSTIKNHTNSNAELQAGWSGSSWVKAAEIIRYSNAGWAATDITAFEKMLKNVYLDAIIGGSTNNGNWELVMMEAAVGIAVFTNDAATYDEAMAKFNARVPAYIYLTSDGSYPKAAPGHSTKSSIISFWAQGTGMNTFPVNGIAQETCRDFTHTSYGVASISSVAETSRIQGNNLWSTDLGTRVRYALEFHTQYELGAAIPGWLCGGKVNLGFGPVSEVGYDALHTRLNYSMPETETWTNQQRPEGTNNLFVGWETLTHASNTA